MLYCKMCYATVMATTLNVLFHSWCEFCIANALNLYSITINSIVNLRGTSNLCYYLVQYLFSIIFSSLLSVRYPLWWNNCKWTDLYACNLSSFFIKTFGQYHNKLNHINDTIAWCHICMYRRTCAFRIVHIFITISFV